MGGSPGAPPRVGGRARSYGPEAVRPPARGGAGRAGRVSGPGPGPRLGGAPGSLRREPIYNCGMTRLDIVLWPDPILLEGTELPSSAGGRPSCGPGRRGDAPGALRAARRGPGRPPGGHRPSADAGLPLGRARRRGPSCINPELIDTVGREELGEEGCLSFPGHLRPGAARRRRSASATSDLDLARLARWSLERLRGAHLPARARPPQRPRSSSTAWSAGSRKKIEQEARGASRPVRFEARLGALVKAMRRFDGLEALDPATFRRPVATVGVFDGLHRGHRHVLDAPDRDLRRPASSGEAVVVTFETHPHGGHRPGAPPRHILSLAASPAAARARWAWTPPLVLPFDEAMRAHARTRRFTERRAGRGAWASRGLLFGYNSNFGHGGQGTCTTASSPWVAEHGFEVERGAA